MLEVGCYYYIPPRYYIGIQLFKVISREDDENVCVDRIYGTDVGYSTSKNGPLHLSDTSSNGRASLKISEDIIPKLLALYT